MVGWMVGLGVGRWIEWLVFQGLRGDDRGIEGVKGNEWSMVNKDE